MKDRISEIVLLSFALILLLFGIGVCFAHDKHAAPISRSMHDWFMDLKNQQGYPCCSDADGANVAEADWDSKDGHYRVRIEDEWVDVPDEAVITVPNKYGLPMVWLQYKNGERIVRCFMPGAGG